MKFKKNFLFFLTFLLTSCGTKTNSNNITSNVSENPNNTNSKITTPSTSNSDTTSEEEFECNTDVYSDDFKDSEDNGNYEFDDEFHEIVIDENSEFINIPIHLRFFKKLKTYDKYISIQYAYINILEGYYPFNDHDPNEEVSPVKQGTPIFIQKQTDDFFEKHYAHSTNKLYMNDYKERFLLNIQIPTKNFIDTYKETGYDYFYLSFCEFAEADGYTYTDGVKDEFIKNIKYQQNVCFIGMLKRYGVFNCHSIFSIMSPKGDIFYE